MRKLFFLLINVLTGFLVANSQTGVWSGDLELQGMKLPIVFHLDDENPTVDSPNQGAKGIPIKLNRIAPDSVSISIPAIWATFNGKQRQDEIVGVFSQRGLNFPLILKQGDKKNLRPQTPKPPFPYSTEEVSFRNGDAVLKGTLTLPEGYNSDTPVIIMVTGSGLQNRDEELFEHKPFAVIADALARNGIATLRYDDRGFGESTGDAANCTTEDLKNDALAGINLLRERFKKVGVLGHSEGGTIALMLGAEKKVDFLISLAGMAVSGKETLLDQNRYMLEQAGYPKQTVDEYCKLLSMLFENDKSWTEKMDSTSLPADLKQNLKACEQQLDSQYMQYFLATDIRNILGNIVCPVLALNGTKDTQVFYHNNLEALKAGLPNNPLNKIEALEGLNHIFQHCDTGSFYEYGTIEETISPEVLEIISQWVGQQ